MGTKVSGISCNLQTPYCCYLGVFHFSAETPNPPQFWYRKRKMLLFGLEETDLNTGTTSNVCKPWVCLSNASCFCLFNSAVKMTLGSLWALSWCAAGHFLLMTGKILPKAVSLPHAHIASGLPTLQIIAFHHSKRAEKEQKLERLDPPGEVHPGTQVSGQACWLIWGHWHRRRSTGRTCS